MSQKTTMSNVLHTLFSDTPITTVTSVSSTEIARSLGKQHNHVMRDIRTMLSRVAHQCENREWQEAIYKRGECAPANVGKTKEIILSKQLALCLIAQYDYSYTLAILRYMSNSPKVTVRVSFIDAVRNKFYKLFSIK